MNILLCGYMGAGKSTVGKRLADALKRSFIDLDPLIEEDCRLSIQKIFDDKGEAFFRQKESAVLKEVLINHTNTIIALGGGALTKEENSSAIAGKSTLVYLEVSPKLIIKRIKNDSTQRPLLEKYKTDEELRLFIQAHLKERLKYYQKADIIINTENKTIDDIVKELISSINLSMSHHE